MTHSTRKMCVCARLVRCAVYIGSARFMVKRKENSTNSDQVLFFADSVPGRECDNTVCVMSLVTHVVKVNKFSGAGQGLGRSA